MIIVDLVWDLMTLHTIKSGVIHSILMSMKTKLRRLSEGDEPDEPHPLAELQLGLVTVPVYGYGSRACLGLHH
jgi:hypothetical protein